MKTLPRLLIVLLCLLGTLASAQAPLRVLVLPFDADATAENYGLGLAAGVQRGLNSLEGVYVPPVGDGALLVGRLLSTETGLTSTVTSLFRADAIVSGALTATDSQLNVTLAFSGPMFPEPKQTSLTVSAVSSALVRETVETVLAELGVSVDSAVQARIDTIAAQAPSIYGMGPFGTAAARLGANVTALAGALETDGHSSWVHSEHARALMINGDAQAALAASERALSLNRNDAEVLVNHAIILTQLDRAQEAAAIYDEALALNSWHAIALTGQALLQADNARARALLERATESYPRMVDAWLDQVALAPDTGRALQLLRRATTYLPESIQLHREFVLRTIAAGDAEAALTYLRERAGDQLAASPSLYALVIHLPERLSAEGIAFAREGAAVFPDSTIPGLAEAHLLRRNGQLAEAETLLRTLHTAHPDDAEVVNQLAITVATAGRVSEARELFEQLSGTSPAVQLNLAQVLLLEGQSEAALQLLQPLAEAPAADADTLTLYADALARTGNSAAAETAYNQALSLDPDWQPARAGLNQLNEQTQVTGGRTVSMPAAAASAFERGLNALSTADWQSAVIEFTSATEQGGGPLAEFYRGYALQMSGRVRDAIVAYEAAQAGLPDSDVVLNNLGYAPLVVGRYDLALPLLRQAVAANSGNSQAHMNLGLAYFGLGRYSDAVGFWEQALTLQPDLAGTLDELIQEARSRSGQ